MSLRRLGILAALGVALAGAARAEPATEPEGYRMEAYRAPTPETLAGATVVGTAEARRLWETKQADFIDVLPHPARPAGLPPKTYWRPAPRKGVPGAVWLPNTGYGAISPEIQAYFEAGLQAASGGDPARPLLFYCKRDCWMSWNAAKRALENGRSRVLWWPDGTDGWAEAGLPLESLEPFRPHADPRAAE